MNKCPKCNSWHMIGPRYRKGFPPGDSNHIAIRESLEYTCATCGYSAKPCADSDEKALNKLNPGKERVGRV